jgi:hypothetical protein
MACKSFIFRFVYAEVQERESSVTKAGERLAVDFGLDHWRNG